MQIERIGSIKKRKISVKASLLRELIDIQAYAKEELGVDAELSDVLGSAISDPKVQAKIPPKTEKKEVTFSLPLSLWKTVDDAAQELGSDKDYVIEKIIENQAKNRGFMKWKKNRLSETQIADQSAPT